MHGAEIPLDDASLQISFLELYVVARRDVSPVLESIPAVPGVHAVDIARVVRRDGDAGKVKLRQKVRWDAADARKFEAAWFGYVGGGKEIGPGGEEEEAAGGVSEAREAHHWIGNERRFNVPAVVKVRRLVGAEGRGGEAEGGVEVDGDPNGFWLGPTLFDNVTPKMSIYTDEIFGPVLSVIRVKTYAEALKMVNDHLYGNGTAIFTNDGGAARRYQNEVEVGMVGINVPIPVPMAYYSFGGWKASLFGDTHAHGMEGVHFFTRGKVVTSRWLDPSHGGINLGFPQNV